MSKVLSVRVSDELFDMVKSCDLEPKDVVESALTEYFAIAIAVPNTAASGPGEYDLLCRCLDSLKSRVGVGIDG